MKPTNTVAKLFSSVSTLAVVAGAIAFNGVALGQRGQVVAWGNNSASQCIIPDAAKSDVDAIAGSGDHGIALKGGAVLAWGWNGYGQCTIPAAASSGVSAIAGGIYTTIALKDGVVLAWGYNGNGQCNIPVDALSGVSAIAGGAWHTIALKNGAVLAWGSNQFNQCTIPYSGAASSGVSAIAGGAWHTIALKNGGVLAWGYNDFDQCITPAVAKSGVTAIAGGEQHTIALKNGEVLAWGRNTDGQCNVPTSAKSGVTAIAASDYFAIALFDPNDLDGDGIPNASDNCPSVANPTQVDCDGNGVGDACEIQLDCNSNGIADVCEILSGTVTDQNLNGIPDTCELATVTRVQPISGPSTGGTAVRITGTNFFSALPVSVTFGGAPATNVVVVSLTEITAVTPSGSPGDTFVGVNGAGAEEFYYRPSCDGDLDNNGTIDSSDLGLLLINMGDCSSSLTTEQPQEPMIFPIEAVKPVAVKK